RWGPAGEPWRIWAVAVWNVVAEPLDAQAALAFGLERKPELILYRRLARSLDRESAALVRGVLGEVHSLLALSCRPNVSRWQVLMGLLSSPEPSDAEVQALCRQLQAYRIER